VEPELVGDDLPLRHGVIRRAIHDCHQHAGALDVSQEGVAQALALVGALDETGDVGDHRASLVVEDDDAQVGSGGREGVARDPGLRLGERRQQRRLAGVRRPDEPDVGDELQLELDPAFLAGLFS
jgi:hypothetical protein